MYSFDTPWASEIADVTGDTQYQNALIRIIDPSAASRGEYNPETGAYDGATTPAPIYADQARVIPIRSGSFQQGTLQANSAVITAVRVQLPRKIVGRLHKGFRVEVTECDNDALVGRWFTIADDLQGSSVATRTFTAWADSDTP